MSDVVVGWMRGSESGNGSLLKRIGIEQRVDIADGSPSGISKPGHWEMIHGIGRTMGNNRGKMSYRESNLTTNPIAAQFYTHTMGYTPVPIGSLSSSSMSFVFNLLPMPKFQYIKRIEQE
jgi:hypothetical protein